MIVICFPSSGILYIFSRVSIPKAVQGIKVSWLVANNPIEVLVNPSISFWGDIVSKIFLSYSFK